MKEEIVSVVIPNYNGRVLIGKNLPTVIRACQNWAKSLPRQRRGWEIVVVDDASVDDSVEFIKKNFPEVKLIANKKNLRFAATCNIGVQKADGEIIILLNNDVSPELDFLKFLVPHFQDPLVFGVGCKEKDVVGKRIICSGRAGGVFKRGFLFHWREKDQDQSETLWTAGGSMAVSRNKWLEIGGMDTLFRPAYWEDIDLSWRARKKGWKVLFEPKAMVNHQHETTNINAFGKKKMKTFAYKNQFLFVWKNGDLKMLLDHLFWLPYYLIIGSVKTRGLIALGFILALFQLPELIKRK